MVIAHGAAPGVEAAVRSLQAQDMPVEIVVVSSGGPDPTPRLRRAGLAVPVQHRSVLLAPGAARNVGILQTRAPYVAFLAADCVARPNWVRGRLTAHDRGAQMVSSAVLGQRQWNPFSWAVQAYMYPRRMPGTAAADRIHYGVSYARPLFRRFGLFAGHLRTGEDTEFHQRIGDRIAPTWAGQDVISEHAHAWQPWALWREMGARGARAARLIHEGAAGPRIYGTHLARGRRVRQRLQLALAGARRRRERWMLRLAAPVLWLLDAAFHRGLQRGLQRGPANAPAVEPHRPAAAPAIPWVGCSAARPRVIALLTFRDEMRHLPDFFRSVAPHVDGFVALDDGSRDGSAAFVARQPGLLELIRRPHSAAHVWEDGLNHRLLVEAAWAHAPDWLLCLDADERLECGFRERVRALLEAPAARGAPAYALRVLHPWNDGRHHRVDGVWGSKLIARLFRARYDHVFDDRRLHGQWAPLNSKTDGGYPPVDALVYHLGMLGPAQRERRLAKYRQADPDNRWQRVGYDYFRDEQGLRLEPLPAGREYLGCDSALACVEARPATAPGTRAPKNALSTNAGTASAAAAARQASCA